MLGIQNFEAFLIAGVLLNMVPGSDTFYVLSRSIAQGHSLGVASVLGISAGALLHTVMAAIGLSAIIAASTQAFFIVQLLGAAYLIYLGVKMFLSGTDNVTGPPSYPDTGFGKAFKQGLLTNALNPKVAMFFLAFLPQFVSSDTQSVLLSFFVLGLTFAVTSTIWCLCLVWFSASISSKIRQNPNYLNYLNKLAGTIIFGIGVRLAVEK